MILDAFRNNFGLVIFICEKQPKKHFHYSQRHFSAIVKFKNIYVGPEHFQYPLKQFWTHSETFPDQWFSSAKSNHSGSGCSGTFPVFLSEKSQKFPEQFWHPPRISRHVLKPF
jgi:hypothetical protein